MAIQVLSLCEGIGHSLNDALVLAKGAGWSPEALRGIVAFDRIGNDVYSPCLHILAVAVLTEVSVSQLVF